MIRLLLEASDPCRSVEAHNRAKRPRWLSRCYLRSSICFKHPPRSILPSAAEGFVDLNQREQLITSGLGEVQFSSKKILIGIESIEHRVHAAKKSHIR